MSPEGSAYRADLDGLRALAVLAVVAYHAHLPGFDGGFVGVDVFFVISGYLITGLLIGDAAPGAASLRAFYARRIRRLVPAFLAVALPCYLLAYRVMLPEELEETSLTLAGASVFVANLVLWQRDSYFSPLAAGDPFLHTWSLSVEEQFYLLFPWLLLALWRRGARMAGGVVLGGALASFALSVVWLRTDPAGAFYLLPARAWELLAGSLCAIWPSRRARGAAAWAGLAAIGAGIVAFSRATPFPGPAALLPVLGAVLVVRHGRSVRLLGARPLVVVGRASYSIYLWHHPVFVFARMTDALGTAAGRWVLVGLSVAMGLGTWALIEQPFRGRRGGGGAARPARGVLTLVGVSAALAAVTAWVALLGEGLPGRFGGADPELHAQYRASMEGNPRGWYCVAREGAQPEDPADYCRYGPTPSRVAILGDSHTSALAFELGGLLAERGIGTVHIAARGCEAISGDTSTVIGRWMNDVVERVAADDDIDVAIVSYRLQSCLLEPADPADPGSALVAADNGFAARLAAMLERLGGGGRRVLLVEQPPELPAPMGRLLEQEPAPGGRIPGLRRAEWEQRRQQAAAAMILPPGVDVVEVSDQFCDAHRCHAGASGRAWYLDDNHLSLTGARRIALVLLPQVEANVAGTGAVPSE